MTAMSATGGITAGIDIGTTSVKAVAADPDGNVVARCRVPHRLVIPAADRMEHDADEAWRRGPQTALARLVAADPVAVAVVAMVPSLTAVDAEGVPRTPGLLYGDARGRPEGDTGPSDGREALGFLRWQAARYPDAFGYWPAQAVANFALADEPVLDGATAFSTTPLYGLDGWDAALIEGAGARVEQMPRVVGNGQAVGTVRGTGIVLGASAVDAMGEQIVAGADEVGDVLVIMGTTLIPWVVVEGQPAVGGLYTIPSFVTPGRFLLGGPSNAGGLFLDWARRLFGDADLGGVRPGSVPIFLPYIRGERAPYHDAARRAVLHGLDLTHDAAACLRAAYEASGFATRHILDLARGGGAEPRRLVATGGGTRVGPWVQALADCTGLPVDVVAVAEGGALGAAWFARMAVGLESSMSDAARWARVSHRVEPDENWVGPCEERYRRYRALADAPGAVATGPAAGGAPV
jgi:xylulokinase